MLGITCKGRLNRTQYWLRGIVAPLVIGFMLVQYLTPASNDQPDGTPEYPFISARRALAREVLLIKKESTDKEHDLSKDALLEKALDQLERAEKRQMLDSISGQFKDRAGAKPSEQEMSKFEEQINQQYELQSKLIREENKTMFIGIITNKKDLKCPFYNIILPIVDIIINAKDMPEDKLEKYTSIYNSQDNLELSKLLEHFVLTMLLELYAILFLFSTAIRRGHDLNKSGWVTVIMAFIPILNVIYNLYLMFFRGTSGSNNYD